MSRRYAHLSIANLHGPVSRITISTPDHRNRFARRAMMATSTKRFGTMVLYQRRRKGSGDLPGLQSRRFVP